MFLSNYIYLKKSFLIVFWKFKKISCIVSNISIVSNYINRCISNSLKETIDYFWNYNDLINGNLLNV